MVPIVARAQLHRSPGFAAVAAWLTAYTGVAASDATYVDLYSCFPAAVRIQVAELGLGDRQDLTVTGGMSFAGGPLNSYVLQSTVAMAKVLRDDPAATGLVTCVSGMVTKQAGAVWSATPPATPFHGEDLSARTAEAATTCEVVGDYRGWVRWTATRSWRGRKGRHRPSRSSRSPAARVRSRRRPTRGLSRRSARASGSAGMSTWPGPSWRCEVGPGVLGLGVLGPGLQGQGLNLRAGPTGPARLGWVTLSGLPGSGPRSATRRAARRSGVARPCAA